MPSFSMKGRRKTVLLLFGIILVLGTFHIHFSQQWMKSTSKNSEEFIREQTATRQASAVAEAGQASAAAAAAIAARQARAVKRQTATENQAAATWQPVKVFAQSLRGESIETTATEGVDEKNAEQEQEQQGGEVVNIEAEEEKEDELNQTPFSFYGASWIDSKSSNGVEDECFSEVSYGVFQRIGDSKAILKTGIPLLDQSDDINTDNADVSISGNSAVTCRKYSHPQYIKNDANICDLRHVAINWNNVERPRQHLWNSNIRYTLKAHAIVVQLDSKSQEDTDTDTDTEKQHHLVQKTLMETANIAGEVELVHTGTPESLSARCSESNTMPAKLVMTVARADDHCPFFVTSIILNAWMILEFLGVHPNDAQLMFMDDGDLAARHLPYDDMIKKAITPKNDIIYGGRGPMDSHGGTTCFKRLVTIPSEYASPIMSRLNSVTPCGKSALVRDFAKHIINKALPENPLIPTVHFPATSLRPRVTILYRRPHAQRKSLGRVIANENELTSAFEREPMFKGQVKALDFGADSWSFEQQAQVMQETDVLVGFHGAQLVNALWLKEGSTLIEVFAKGHKRYTYDHISKYMGHSYVRIETHQRNEPRNGYTVPVADVVRSAVQAVKKQQN